MGKRTSGQKAALAQIAALKPLSSSESGLRDALRGVFSAIQEEVSVHLWWFFPVDPTSQKISDASFQLWAENPGELETGPLFLDATLFPSIADLREKPDFSLRGEGLWTKKNFEASALYQGVLNPEGLVHAHVSLLVDDQQHCQGYSVFWRRGNQGPFSKQDASTLSLFLTEAARLFQHRTERKRLKTVGASLFEPIEKVAGISEEELYSLIRRRAQPGVLVLDQDGQIVSVNQDARHFLSRLSLKNDPIRTIFENESHGIEDDLKNPKKSKSFGGGQDSISGYPEIIHQLYRHFIASVKKNEGGLEGPIPTINRVCIQGEIVYLLRALMLEAWERPADGFHFIILVERVSQGLRVDQIDWEAKLTPRENEVVKSLLEGKTNKEVAVRIEIGEYTVKDHIKRIMKKLEVTTRAGIVAKVLQHHFPA